MIDFKLSLTSSWSFQDPFEEYKKFDYLQDALFTRKLMESVRLIAGVSLTQSKSCFRDLSLEFVLFIPNAYSTVYKNF